MMLRWSGLLVSKLIAPGFQENPKSLFFAFASSNLSRSLCFVSKSIDPRNPLHPKSNPPILTSASLDNDLPPPLPLSGLEGVMMDYVFGKNKATQLAHSVWKHVIQKGDVVVDATCGNGYDTLAMVKMVADKAPGGRVYAMDIQETALKHTMCLLDRSLDPDEKKIVELFATCHSKMEEVVPRDAAVRVVAFNLGYLPGGDKTVITKSETTLSGIEAASRILARGGLVSVMVYVGHPGGMEEFKKVEAFACGLAVDSWICSKLQMLNRPSAPVLVLLCKR